MLNLTELTPEKIKEILKNPKVRKYIILGCILIFGFFYMVFMGLGKFSSLSKVLLRVKELKNNIELADNRGRRLDVMTKKLEELKAELEAYSQGIPDQKDLPEFLEELSSVAESSNVKILSITPSDLKPLVKESGSAYYREIPIVITAKSGYHELGYFISDLETSKRFITIAGLRMRYNPKTPRKHDVKMILKTYVSVM
ncbi:MAG: type 4a pilus biogenesis protein PilO [Candidatus Omnitrophota bacterium]